jgi:DNA-binding beta-propeller fold protein YncE
MRKLAATCLMLLAAGCTPGPEDNSDESAFLGWPRPLPPMTRTFTTFESGQVRPLALSPNGRLLFAVNTPDNRLEIFKTDWGKLTRVDSLQVGLEPVAVAARNDDEVWVVNHLSDSVSVVKVNGGRSARVVGTIQVGDEPRDIVFAGPQKNRAFITTAHRGQNSPVNPQISTPGVGRADVWVFNCNETSAPLNIITLFADTPRALAASADGKTVYAAAFASGNQTTVISKGSVEAGGGLPVPNTIKLPNGAVIPQPVTALIVKRRADGTWRDAHGKDWSAQVKFNLPDKDVFAIDAMSNPPRETRSYATVGTTLFAMAVNPVNGKVYVANTEALNDVRFEGHGAALAALGLSPRTVRGHLAESRITVLDGNHVLPRHLNKHINYDVESTPGENEKSLAFPQALAVSKNGQTLYVAAQGSSKVGVFSTAQIENDSFVPSTANQIAVSGGGPSGVVLDENNKRLYVLTRFDNGISSINTQSKTEVAHLKMYNPEPEHVVKGRPFLYDASYTSSHGDSACASCHIAGDMDQLAWDLGNPDGFPVPIPGPMTIPTALILQILPQAAPVFAALMPLKGPMTTQSLRGMDNHGAMHWRGDRFAAQRDAAGNFINAQPDTGSFNENSAFLAFNGAFEGLLGRTAILPADEMQQFSDFALEISYPPNPIRNLDNSLTASQQAGRDFYFRTTVVNGQTVEFPSDRFHNCNGCHTLDPQGNAAAGVRHPGFFGTSGLYSFENEPQIFKVPHLRNMYQKVGMFGMAPDSLIPATLLLPQPHMGDQIRGFGFQHDGAIDTVNRFFENFVFTQLFVDTENPGGPTLPPIPPNPGGIPFGPAGNALRGQLEDFMMAFDSNLAPVVGQQVTLNDHNRAANTPRLDLLEARAAAGECDLMVVGDIKGRSASALFGNGQWRTDRALIPPISDHVLRSLIRGPVSMTFTCLPPGSGPSAIDRDGDGWGDGDEQDLRTDPADASSHP